MSKEISATELLAAGLQKKKHECRRAVQCKHVLKRTLQNMSENTHKFFSQIKLESEKFEIETPVLPRWHRLPHRFDSGSDNTRFTSPVQFFTMQYVEIIDLITNKLDERFDQEALQYLSDIEHVVLATERGENTATLSLKDDTKTKLDGDIDIMALENELKFLKNIASACMQESFITLSDISKVLTPVMRGIYENVSKHIQLYITIPMSNAAAERSFSCLRR